MTIIASYRQKKSPVTCSGLIWEIMLPDMVNHHVATLHVRNFGTSIQMPDIRFRKQGIPSCSRPETLYHRFFCWIWWRLFVCLFFLTSLLSPYPLFWFIVACTLPAAVYIIHYHRPVCKYNLYKVKRLSLTWHYVMSVCTMSYISYVSTVKIATTMPAMSAVRPRPG